LASLEKRVGAIRPHPGAYLWNNLCDRRGLWVCVVAPESYFQKPNCGTPGETLPNVRFWARPGSLRSPTKRLRVREALPTKPLHAGAKSEVDISFGKVIFFKAPFRSIGIGPAARGPSPSNISRVGDTRPHGHRGYSTLTVEGRVTLLMVLQRRDYVHELHSQKPPNAMLRNSVHSHLKQIVAFCAAC
jgi:hypothetical protein